MTGNNCYEIDTLNMLNNKIDTLNKFCIEYVIYFVKHYNDYVDEFGDEENYKIDIYNLTNDDFDNYILDEFVEDGCYFMAYLNKRNFIVPMNVSNNFINLILQKTIQNLNITNDKFIQELKQRIDKLFEAYAFSYLENLGLENLKLKIKPEIDFVHHFYSLGDNY